MASQRAIFMLCQGLFNFQIILWIYHGNSCNGNRNSTSQLDVSCTVRHGWWIGLHSFKNYQLEIPRIRRDQSILPHKLAYNSCTLFKATWLTEIKAKNRWVFTSFHTHMSTIITAFNNSDISVDLWKSKPHVRHNQAKGFCFQQKEMCSEFGTSK